MKAVILAGGFGTRISEESYLKPKPMIEVGEKPILWHIMKLYSYYGINDFIIIKEGESEGYSSCYHPGADRMNNNNYCNPLFLKLSFSSCSSVVSA